MDFNQDISDKEVLSHVKTLLKVPLARRSLLANIEQITFTFKEILENPGTGKFPWNAIPISSLKNKEPALAPDDKNETPLFPFSLVRKRFRWILEDIPGNNSHVRRLFYSLGVSGHITIRLGKVKKMEGEMLCFPGIPWVHWISITAEKVSWKRITGTVLVYHRKKTDPKQSLPVEGEESKILFINSEKLKSIPDAPGIYRMIEDISANPELGVAMWEYYHLKLKPLLREGQYSGTVG